MLVRLLRPADGRNEKRDHTYYEGTSKGQSKTGHKTLFSPTGYISAWLVIAVVAIVWGLTALKLKDDTKNRLVTAVAGSSITIAKRPRARIVGAHSPIEVLGQAEHNVIRKQVIDRDAIVRTG